MDFGAKDDDTEVMHEINMTPLVDVMLVLLIIFIITVPVMKHAVEVQLPRASNQPQDFKPETIRLTIDAQGNYYWNDAKIEASALASQLQAASLKTPQPELHIQGDRAVRYESVAQAMALARRSGVSKIGFIIEPGTLP